MVGIQTFTLPAGAISPNVAARFADVQVPGGAEFLSAVNAADVVSLHVWLNSAKANETRRLWLTPPNVTFDATGKKHFATLNLPTAGLTLLFIQDRH